MLVVAFVLTFVVTNVLSSSNVYTTHETQFLMNLDARLDLLQAAIESLAMRAESIHTTTTSCSMASSQCKWDSLYCHVNCLAPKAAQCNCDSRGRSHCLCNE